MATKKAKKPREEKKRPSAVVIPFPVVPRRGAEVAGELPFSVVPEREAPRTKLAPKPANTNERPAPSSAARRKWWQMGILVSVALHLAAAAIFQAKYSHDLERAAGAATAAATEGAVIPIEITITAPAPSAPTPTEANDGKKAAQTQSKETADDKQKSSPPPKSDTAAEVVPTAKETPQPDKQKQEQKKERAQQSQSAAANPNQAAASRSQGRAGAGGRAETGGTANVSTYRGLVHAHLQRYRTYPPDAGGRGGAAVVTFTLSSNGGVISAGLARSSGSAALDQAAVSMVRRASPFPPFPPGTGSASLAFTAPVSFTAR